MALPDLSTQIGTAATGPVRAEADGQVFQAQTLADQISADRYLKSITASALPRRGLSFTKLQPPGALGQSADSADGSNNFGGGV